MTTPAKPPPPALSIRVLAPLILAAPVLIVSFVLGSIAITQSRRAAEDLAGQIVDQIDARVRQRIADLAETAARASRQSEHLMRVGVFDPEHIAEWLPSLRSQIEIFDEVSGVVWGDRDGRVVWLVDYPDEDDLEFGIKTDPADPLISLYQVGQNGAPGPEPRRRLPYDPRTRPWYLAGAAALGAESPCAWTDAYSWVRADGSGVTLGISYARAIPDDSGALRGVLDTELELRSVSRFLGTLDIAETGSAFIVDRHGELIAASVGQPIVSAEGGQVLATDAADEPTRLAAAAALQVAGPFADLRAPVRALTHIGSQRAWVGVSPIDSALGLDWILVTIVPESDLLARVEQARRHARIAAAAAVLATLLLGVGVAALAVRPIVRLRDHVRKVGDGDLEREVHLRGARELADLSTNINDMTRGLLDRARLRDSLRLAMDVQQALLPEGPPSIPGLDIAGFSKYCDETGGDYFDFLALAAEAPGQVKIALGDVMGHGVAAALLMASARAVLRSRWSDGAGLSNLLAFVNQQITPDTRGIRFMTMLLMEIDGRHGRLTWSTAGQHCGLLYDAAARDFVALGGAGLPLGLVDAAAYDDNSRDHIPPGSLLLLTTDGLFEAHNDQREQYGWERIRRSILRHLERDAQHAAEGIYNDLLAFCGQLKPEDDVTFIVVKFTA